MFELKKIWLLLGNLSRYFIVTGGRGSGKSYSLNLFLLALTYEQGHTILFTRYTLTSAHISIIPEFLDKIESAGLHEHFYITKDEIINVLTGSKIIFKGIKTSSGNQTANLKSLEGVTTWVLDEAEELVDENTFDKIALSVRKKGIQNRIILILNPTTKQHWIYNKFFQDRGVKEGYTGIKENTTYIHTTYLDNIENLDSDFIADIERMRKTNPDKFRHQILGGWLDKAEGVIYTNWRLGDFPQTNDFGFGLDFGFSVDETALIKVYIDKAQRKIYAKELTYKKRMTTSDIISDIRLHAQRELIVADSAEGRLIEEIKSSRLNIVPVKKGAGSILEGIFLLQDYELIIDPQSINLIRELNNYCWLENRVKAIDNYNHLLDALRYYVSYSLANPNRGRYAVV